MHHYLCTYIMKICKCVGSGDLGFYLINKDPKTTYVCVIDISVDSDPVLQPARGVDPTETVHFQSFFQRQRSRSWYNR